MFADKIAILVMLTADAPSFVRVALRVLLLPTATPPKLSDAGVNPSAKVSPVPVSEIVWVGLPGELSFNVTAPVRVPEAVGVNVIVMVQFCPAVIVAGQVLLWAKSPLLAIEVKFTE